MSIIQPLDVNKFIDNMGLKEITSPILLSAKGKFDVDGLFSEIIFGLNFSSDRRKTYAYINLNTRIIHPFIYEVFNKIERKLIDLINGGTYYYDEANKVLSKDPAENLKEISGFDGAMYAILHGINYRGETDVRDKLVDRLIECVDNRLAFVDKFLVIPPDFRPIQLGPDGSLTSVDDINSTYIKLINYSKKIKLVDNNDANGVMSDSALIRKEIQNLVNDLYLLGKMRTGKKTGISRSSLLGKRVDFSARTVISGGFDLPVGTVGVPYRILASISQPFLVHYFTKVLVPETDNYNKLMEIFKKNKYDQNNNVMVVTNFLADIANDTIKLTKEDEAFIVSTFQQVVNDKYVLMKRDPSFHKDSWQSFRVRVETGVTIGLNITQTTLFNADFDGDSTLCDVKLRYNTY